MNFDFSEEQVMLRKMVRSFVDKEIIPNMREWDERGYFDPVIWKRLRDLDLLGVCIPEQYGGSGMDYNSLAIVCEE
ncbi:acyl-CoA dehydrogenase family protein, partial [Bacillus sp. JJ1764]|uniref:acyl-CoA dehydrogenase family protein n=1 Tax=Bacillus sp. JJ1764 TaxID=3122964 RepID=UPI00300025D0